MDVKALLLADPTRGTRYSGEVAGIYLNYAKQWLQEEDWEGLEAWAVRMGWSQARQHLFQGQAVNRSEARPALHMALRLEGPQDPLWVEGQEVHAVIKAARAQMFDWVQRLHERTWLGSTGRPIRHLIHIGVGGSDLGARLLVDALPRAPEAPAVSFISTLDGVELQAAFAQADPAESLIIIASKSFGTTETLLNAQAAKAWLSAAGLDSVAHLVAITSESERARDFGVSSDHILPIGSWIGGRYSIWSSMGFAAAAWMGVSAFQAFLAGARACDQHFLAQPLRENMPALLGAMTAWYRCAWGIQTEVLLPYHQRLARLPEYVQQLEMESCGKGCTQGGEPAGPTGMAVWGQVGTRAQHAFCQWLHQGSDVVLTNFLVVAQVPEAEAAHHQYVLASALAQSVALMEGQRDQPSPRTMMGGRPSTMWVLPVLSASVMGALLAFYEHKVYTQSVFWNINPFDQFGVDLGKVWAAHVLPHLAREPAKVQLADKPLDPATQAVIERLNT